MSSQSPLPRTTRSVRSANGSRDSVNGVSGAFLKRSLEFAYAAPRQRRNKMTTWPSWRPIAILVARLIFAAVFLMATVFKFVDMNGTATYIAAAGFPLALPLAWLAAIFELALVLCFLTGAFFTDAALLAAL